MSAPAVASAPPLRVAPLDRDMLLRVAALRLADAVKTAIPRADGIVVKYLPAKRYLVLTPSHWNVLRAFSEGKSVPSVLKQLMLERNCVALAGFYELVLRAHDAGLLQAKGQPTPAVTPPAPWRHALGARWGRYPALFALAAAAALLGVLPPTAPGHWLWWAPGWALTCLGVSAGYFLAACRLHEADLDVYHPRRVWGCLVPRFQVDLCDSVMGGPALRMDCALLRVAPQALLLALALLAAPDLAAPLLCGLLLLLAPFGTLPGAELLREMSDTPRLSIAPRGRGGPRWPGLRRLLAQAGCVLLWLLAAGLAGALIAPHVAVELIARARAGELFAFAGMVAAVGGAPVAALIVAGPVRRRADELLSRARTWREERARERAEANPAPTPGEILEFLSGLHPFPLLPLEQRSLVAEAMSVSVFKTGAQVVEADDRTPRLLLLYSGRLQVQRRGRFRYSAPLGPGTIFAETLLDEAPKPDPVRAAAPSVVLTLGAVYYDSLVAPWVSRSKMEDAAQKIAFLREIPLSRRWSPAMQASFARRAVVHVFAAGELLVEEGRENTHFFLLQEGSLRVTRGGRRLARLGRGDFFGEISILQNSVATADVSGLREGRCLALSKHEFLAFVTQDPEVAMQFEGIASRRLKAPLFPG